MVSQEGDLGGEKVITANNWKRGERPRGYEETSTNIRAAHALGLHMRDFFDQSFLSKREALIDKAEKEGLAREEAEEMVSISKKINQTLAEALRTVKK